MVSMLHTVFDLLAFKNDIGFWKANKSMEGLSAKTVLINAVCQVREMLTVAFTESFSVQGVELRSGLDMPCARRESQLGYT